MKNAMTYMIQSDKYYTPNEIIMDNLVPTPRGTTNLLSRYQYVLRMINQGKLQAERIDEFKYGYKVKGSELKKFLGLPAD